MLMRYLSVLLLVGFASSQFFFQPNNFNRGQRFFRPFQPQQQQFRQPQRQQQFFPRQQSFNNNNNFQNNFRGAAVDDSLGNSDYHYSWRHAGFNTKWVWGGAVGYCNRLGGGWAPISINDASENNLVRNALARENVAYIWTSGQLAGNGWRWSNGPFQNIGAWSPTGGLRRPQPDNREGGENCLAVLNNIYQDGITWHDIGCSHQKPVICERSKF